MTLLFIGYLAGAVGFLIPDLAKICYFSYESFVNSDSDVKSAMQDRVKTGLVDLQSTLLLGLVWPFIVLYVCVNVVLGFFSALF